MVHVSRRDLGRDLRHHFRHRRPPVLLDPVVERARRREQVWTLADIAEQALLLQPQAETAIVACGVLGTVPDCVALDLGQLSHCYSRLSQQLKQLTVDPPVVGLRNELRSVLSYHLHMLRDAGDLAFSGRRDPRTERFRLELAEGLGPYAARLAELTAECEARLHAASQQP